MIGVLALAQPTLLWWPTAAELILGIAAIQAAFILRFLLQSVIAMLCFWSERAAALDRLLLIPYLFLSGLVAPLQTYPPTIQKLAWLTPFPSMVAFPAAVLAGEPVAIGQGFLQLALWCLLLYPLLILLWRAGIRRYGAMGA
jgi:ABC-2 type transport system permease protein